MYILFCARNFTPNYLSNDLIVKTVPTVKRKKDSGNPGEWYIHIQNSGSGPPYNTLQVSSVGRDILLSANLDHDNTPKRAAYLDWDLFHTLDKIGHLGTKGEDSNSTDQELEQIDKKSVDNLSPEQRVAFATGLIDHESAKHLVETEQILELFQSLSPEVPGYDILLSELLRGTPFEPATILDIDTLVDEFSPTSFANVTKYNTTLLALIMKLIFESIASTTGAIFDSITESRECHELWLFDHFIAIGGNELILHPVAEHMRKGIPDGCFESLQADSISFLNPLNIRFLQAIYPSISKGQLQTELRQFGTTMENESQSGHLLLFPKPRGRSDSDLQAKFNEI